MTEITDCVVIGAGVIGLAIAREMAKSGREVLLLESESSIGNGTSSRNSEIIHSGVYYPTNSLKARLCVKGRKMIYNFCKEYGVETKKTGKIIFASDKSEIKELKRLQSQALMNGVPVTWLKQKQLEELEPNLKCEEGIFLKETGIIDTHSLMLALQGDSENNGAIVSLKSKVTSGTIENSKIILDVGYTNSIKLSCNTLINSAGLNAQFLSRSISGVIKESIPPLYFAKGNYFYLKGKQPFSRPVYPIPEESGLGIHYTMDLGGQGKFGPDVEWVNSISYDIDTAKTEIFYNAIKKYWPGINTSLLQPGYAGIRPKISNSKGIFSDFMIQTPIETGCKGYYALYGIESPGLTSSLAIAEYLSSRIMSDEK